ncbi:MAG: hypothetical protein JNL11_07445 [Bdellovibrionaceae bacterium]|nr:hypothetical protein [Pseudobdellovibrionaceae bacterium]
MKLFVILLFVSSFVFAGSVNFDFRFDSDSSSFNNAAKASGRKPTTRYAMTTGRVDFKGNLNQDVNYRLRWRLDRSDATTINKTDAFTTQVDLAYVQDRLMDGLNLTIGKFSSEIGSVEGNIPAPDNYMMSQAYRQISSQGFLYVSGAKLTYHFDEHESSVYVVNQSDATATSQSKSTYGLTYQARLMEKKLKPIVGYLYDEKQSSTSTSKMSTTITSVGVAWDPKPYFINFDYLIYAQKNISAGDTDDTWTTMLVDAGYDFDGIIPKFKYETTQKKISTAAASGVDKYDGFSLGVEYKPYPQDIYRYHLMVTQMTLEPQVGESEYEQHIIAGVRIYGDFLK